MEKNYDHKEIEGKWPASAKASDGQAKEIYDHRTIEAKWQEIWKKNNLYEVADEVKGRDNFYTLVEFPYPSGNLHIGHWYAFAVPDIFARAKRMQGHNVLFPIGFDAFGLPAENAAIKRNIDPKKWTYENIAHMEKQLMSMGNSFDWSRKVVTSDPEYYRWTQWLFLEFYKRGLVYKKKAKVNWCPNDQTVLANEQVVSGECERCGSEVVQKDLEQWFFKITDYAERLLSDLENLDWPEPIKDTQRNWIGKSSGAEISFKLLASSFQGEVKVFTTRADTLFGVTYIVIAPENEWLQQEITNSKSQITNKQEIQNYLNETKSKTEIERTDAKKQKTGVELKGIKAIHPATGEELPVWVADYVLGNYGTGAVMAVPAHDERDFTFAKKYNLPTKSVVIQKMPDPRNPHREGKETIFRDAVIVVVRNPKTDKYLCLKWKKHPWVTFVMGGIEEGETEIEAAEREIKEETGYKNFRFVKKLGIAQSEFFAAHKDVNRIAHTRNLLFELTDEEQDELSAEESEIHELEWRDLTGIKQKDMTHSEMSLILENLNSEEKAFVEEGVLFDSKEFTRMTSVQARDKIAEKYGQKVTKYKLRDWLLSRQRYWGCPIPMVYDTEGQPHPIPEEHLPWLLPEDNIDFLPKGTSPLGSSKELVEKTEKIFGKGWKPELDTMDTFVDSSWYFLAYCIRENLKSQAPISKQFENREIENKIKSWMPVDRYSGGAEHTTMHLLYSRFFHKALFDMGLVQESEPYKIRMNRGLILGPDGQKMSKSKGNVIDPDEWVSKVGADTVRLYLAFIGPYNEVGQYPWDLGGIAGVRRFLERVWRIGINLQEPNSKSQINSDEKNTKLETLLHKTIKKVTEDIENYKFNTAISAMMIYVNELESGKTQVEREDFEKFLKILGPFAPHITEELWSHFAEASRDKSDIGNKTSIHLEKWPEYDENKIKEEKVTIVVQVNSKVRASFEAEANIDESTAKEKALSLPEIQKWIGDRDIKKVIFVPNKLLNIVA